MMTKAALNHAGEALMPMALNSNAKIEFTEASQDREAKRLLAGHGRGGEKVTTPKVPTSSCFKLMTGGEYSVMKDSALGQDSFNDATHFAGVRLYF